MEILSGHISPETAYLVEDYPYGFRLRCKIRYWVEYKRGHGCRMVSQTTNPKRGDVWNKPKASTFSRFGLVMMLDEQGHVINGAQLSEYSSAQESVDFQRLYQAALPCDQAREDLACWVAKKMQYEQAKAAGLVTCTTTTTVDGGKPQVTTEVLQPEGVKL